MSGLKFTTKRTLLLGASTFVAATLALSTPASAQIDEIIVTAQKRSENIQDVPMSVTAIPADDVNTILAAGGDILSLANRTPGLYAESSNGRTAPRFYIRGLGNSDFALQATQPVSVIMDDVVKENVLLKSFPLFDVQQVEVLRGPQGTLFGRNTPAGIVKIDTIKPSHEASYGIAGSYGTYGSSNTQAHFGGSIWEDVMAVRLSGAVLRRDDYIDNTFTGQKNIMGGFNDIAGRAQLLFTPSNGFDALVELHGRGERGTATPFRANILTTGSNQINSNFVKDEVAYDGGDGNPQGIDSSGVSLKMNLDLGFATLTSITAQDSADGFSRGDIDGGNGAFFDGIPTSPGFIPFGSDTGNEYETSQFTQEFRLASNGDDALNWQVGAFFFDSSLEALTDPGFVAPSVLFDDKNAWAVFGQGSYAFSDQTTATVGLRYTEDTAKLHVENAPFGTVVPDVEVTANEVSWDVSLNHALNDDMNIYARVARGFRGPSIQGRDVAFGGVTTTAQPETINSYEIGAKSILMDNRLRLNGALFHYTVHDQQFTAVGGGGNSVAVINADKGVGYGFEVDAQWAVTEYLDLTAGFGYSHTEIKDANLAVSTCGSASFSTLPGAGTSHCTVNNVIDANGNALVDGNPFPNAPEFTANFIADFHMPINDNMNFIASTDWSLQGLTNLFLYRASEYHTNGNFEGGAKIGVTFEDDKYELALFARNITDEVNLAGGIDFNNNTGFVTEPRIFGISFRAHN